MENPIRTREDLKGGKLSEIIAYYMLHSNKYREKFLNKAKSANKQYESILDDYKALYGYYPSSELKEIAYCIEPVQESNDDVSDVWSLNEGIEYAITARSNVEKDTLFTSWREIFTMLTGLEFLAMGPDGDQVCFSTLPNPLKTTEVYRYCHEDGTIDGTDWGSLAQFIAKEWGEYYNLDTEKEINKNNKASLKAIDDFNADFKEQIKQQPYYHNAYELFKRTHWLHSHPYGGLEHNFAKKLSDAPTFNQWLTEKQLIVKEPVLANYWILAHFYLGNTNACLEAINLAKQSESLLTRQLAIFYQNLINNADKTELGKFDYAKCLTVKEKTIKNAPLELLDPARHKEIKKERGEDNLTTLTEDEFKTLLEKGTAPLEIIETYPQDIETHDRALQAIAENDESFKKPLRHYFELKTEKAYHEWYDFWEPYDNRLDSALIAAFLSGLKYDEDHEKSYAGVTRSMAFIDDDRVIDAYKEAVKKLHHSDERIKYIAKALDKSQHPEKNTVTTEVANRFITLVKEKTNSKTKSLKELFGKKNYYSLFLDNAIALSNASSVALIHEIFSIKNAESLFSYYLGTIFKVIGNKKLTEYNEVLKSYILNIKEIKLEWNFDHMNDDLLYALTEASIAYAKLDSVNAPIHLKELMNYETQKPLYNLDIKSGIAGGILINTPDDKEAHHWLERILKNRLNEDRLYGALRAVHEASLKQHHKLVMKHYLHGGHCFYDRHLSVRMLAKEVLEALGTKDFPVFDSSDEYCKNLPLEEIPEAFNHPEKYSTYYLCKRIIKENYKHTELPEILTNHLAEYLIYSIDAYRPHFDIAERFKAIAIQGADAIPYLAKLLPIEANGQKSDIRFLMRLMGSEPDINNWLLTANETEIINELINPQPDFMVWQDIIAAHACMFINTKEAHEAIKESFDRTCLPEACALLDSEPWHVHLPLAVCSCGDQYREYIHELMNQYPEEKAHYFNNNLTRAYNFKQKDKVPTLKDGKTVTLKQNLRSDNYKTGHQWEGYKIKITIKGNKIKITAACEGVSFFGILNQGNQKTSKTINCAHIEEATDWGKKIAQTYLLLGYYIAK